MPAIYPAIALVVIALLFDFFNGMSDSANAVAVLISSRAMRPRQAMLLIGVCELLGPFLFGVSVAVAIGSQVVSPQNITITVTLAALLSAIAWNNITLRLGIPSSSSHALIGGLVGAAIWGFGPQVVHVAGLLKVILALFISPILGLALGFLTIRALLWLLRAMSPRANVWLRRGEWLTAAGLALSHGANDSQKTMGIITLGLVSAGLLPTFRVPLWVIAGAAVSIALGTFIGGWRVIKTLGGRFYKVRPIHAFSSQLAAASIIVAAALLGGPVSTTQVVSSSILGAGSGQRPSQVRWGVAREMLLAWLLTMPATALLAGLIYAPLAWLIR